MARVSKHKLDAFRAEVEKGTPAGHREFEATKACVVEALESTGQVVVAKVRRTERPGAIFEATGQWTGVDPSTDAVVEALAAVWPGAEAPPDRERHAIEVEGELVTLWFAERFGEGAYLTGRVLLRA